ncbi:hypothetical protein [Pseudochelatococcus contaminans]|uniref:Uncharacterized protein n=1 Tax=Pseudochelatococcus contaminans TaxID=1538103 RepID=A0A7W5Z2V0_9HYPH|nr:hypothetical protein [Pseudochelatococcus contaminans]MBB3809096.1 hypothetical protein [Pseudochelatococcus contaminans]
MVVSNVISLFQPRVLNRDWNNQELAEFYRVESALIAVGFHVDTDRGLSDEGDPWFVFVDAATDNVIVHCARCDGAYLIASPAFDSVLRGFDFRSLVEGFLERQPMVLPKADTPEKKSNIRLHPSVLLVALVATAFFKLSSTETEAATIDAASLDDGDTDARTNRDQLKAAKTDLEIDRQQALVVLAAVAVVTGELKLPANDAWPTLALFPEDDAALSVSRAGEASLVVLPAAHEQAAQHASDAAAVASGDVAGAAITTYTAGRAITDLLSANTDEGTVIDIATFKLLDHATGNSSAARNETSNPHPYNPASDAFTAKKHAASVLTDGSNSEITNSSAGSDGAGDKDLSAVTPADTRSTSADADNSSSSTSLTASIKMSVTPAMPARSATSATVAPSSDEKGPDTTELSHAPEETQQETAPVETDEESVQEDPVEPIDIDVSAILSAVAPRLNVSASRVTYSENVQAFDDSARDLIGDFVRQEGGISTFRNGTDIVLYDSSITASASKTVNLVTWSFEDGSSISLIGVFDYDHMA